MSTEFKFGEYSLLNGELENNPDCNDHSCKFNYPCSDKETCSGFKIQLMPGYYMFEVYGAQGSELYHGTGGLGGYGRVQVNITENTTLFLYIGSQGDWVSSGSSKTSFNGGGPGYDSGPGGGATDFRMLEGNLSTRFLIAGGCGAQGLYKYKDGPCDSGKEIVSIELPIHVYCPNDSSNKKLRDIVTISNQGGYGGGENGANGSGASAEGGKQTAPSKGLYKGTFIEFISDICDGR